MTARKNPARKVKRAVKYRYLVEGEILREEDLFNPRSKPTTRYWMPTVMIGHPVGNAAAKLGMYRRILKAKRKTRRAAG